MWIQRTFPLVLNLASASWGTRSHEVFVHSEEGREVLSALQGTEGRNEYWKLPFAAEDLKCRRLIG